MSLNELTDALTETICRKIDSNYEILAEMTAITETCAGRWRSWLDSCQSKCVEGETKWQN